jgi:subtilase family serine protease/prenyltransferase beta subunit
MRVWRLSALLFVFALLPSFAQADTNIDAAIAWLNAHQNANGSWGSVPDLIPRDTARVLLAMQTAHSTSTALNGGYAWLTTQRGFSANQFLAEQAMALTAGNLDNTLVLTQLAQQRSTSGGDYGGFADNTGDSLDSALALQALATRSDLYAAQISTLVTSLMVRQNADGGWGIDQGFLSNVVITAEVLKAFAALKVQQQPPATVLQLAQQFLASRMNTNVLDTAVAFRALALSGYALSSSATATLNYLISQRLADGSWSDDPYLTARVIEALAANKPNLVVGATDVSVSPSTAVDGANVTVTAKVTNIGASPSSSTTLEMHLSDANGRKLGNSANVNGLAPGASQSVSIAFAATSMTGKQTLLAIVDPANTVDELRDDDNFATAPLTVVGKPDLQVYPADMTTIPAHVQPNQAATFNAVIRNGGQGDANGVTYAVMDGATQLVRATIATISAGSSQSISVPLNLSAGSHMLTLTADPDNALPESNETNNQASKTIGVSPLANVDLRIASGAVVSLPAGAPAGQSVTITATVDNLGNTPAQSSVGFFDGDPSLGRLFAIVPLSLDAQTSGQVQATYVIASSTNVIYAVADPQNLIAETDETNNKAYATISSQFVDLSISRDGFVLPRTPLSQGQTMTARAVVRNLGVLPASNVEVIIYDDLPQLGGNAVIDTFVNVPAQGKYVVPASWTVRAGQRIATVVINPTKAVAEIDDSNNRVTRLYVASANEADIALDSSLARAQSVDTTGVIVDAAALTISGLARVSITGSTPRAFAVTIFDDVDGDRAFNPDVDTVLGAAMAQSGLNGQIVQVPLQGTLRYAPGHPMIYLDSGNAVAETNESNNLIDLWQDCQGTVSASPTSFYAWRTNIGSSRQASVARLIDTNGDDFIDDNDVPIVVTTVSGSVLVLRGDTGQLLWSRSTDSAGTNVVPVIADVDGDGKPEIIAHSSNGVTHALVCLNSDGSTKWVSPSLDRDPTWDFILSLDGTYSYVGMPAVADLDGDGKPEIISGRSVLNGLDGTLKWVGSGGAGRVWDPNDFSLYFSNADLEGPIAADVDGDGKLEVVAGNTAYRANGTILWMRGDLPDGLTAAVYFPNQTTPNVCLVAAGNVWMLNGPTGTTIWGPVPVPGGARFGGAPTVFMDGTVGLSIGVAGEGRYSVLSAQTGAVRWSDGTLGNGETAALTQNAATAFDFGAGQWLAYSGQSHFYIFRAADGLVEQTLDAHVNLPFPGAPTIADMDGDGHADIYVPDTSIGFGMLSNKTWNGAPSIYNEASYHVVNVANEEAAIPAHETPTAFSKVNWRTNLSLPPGTAGRIAQPNLVASYPRIDASHYPSHLGLIVRIANNGWADAGPVSVSFFRVNADNSSTFLGVTQTTNIPAGGYQDVVYQVANPPLGAFSFRAIADRDASGASLITECNESDNQSPVASTQVVADVAIDPASIVASNTQPLPNTTIDLTALATLTGSIDATALKAQFFLNAANGTAISQPLPVVITTVNGVRTASVTYTWTVNVAVGTYDIYAVFDPANVIAETNESNNSGKTTINVSATQNADIATNTALFVVSDPQPRPGDAIQLGASAHLSGLFDTSLLNVQFFNGNPASGGTPISPLLPATITTSGSFHSASVTYAWTVNLTQGNYTLYAVFDPMNAIQEIDETNNTATAALQVSSPEIIKKLSATLTLSPPTAESGTPVAVTALVQNIGNAALSNATVHYTATGPGGSTFNGSATIASFAKNALANLSFGSFVPSVRGTYIVTLTADADVTVVADPKSITIAPFATAQLTAVPQNVPTSLPIVQILTRISRTNTIAIPDDPLVPLVKSHLQLAVNWEQSAMVGQLTDCYRCHIHAQGLAGLEASARVSGVTVDSGMPKQIFDWILSRQSSDGAWRDANIPKTATTSATWSLAYWSDATQIKVPLSNGLNYLLTVQDADGGFTCDDCRISFSGRETPTMLAMVAFARGWEQTNDPRYQAALNRMVNWSLNYNYQATATTGPEFAARVAIGLAYAIPDLQDAALQSTARARLQTIAQFLRSQQNPDGSFGVLTQPDFPVLRTAQSLYVLALAGTPGNDPGLRNAILWLINHQLPAGGWSEWRSEQTSPVHWWDETTWAMIALPAAFLRLGQFDVDYNVLLPSTSTLVSASPTPATASIVSGGTQLVWHLSDVTEAGTQIAYNVRLNGLTTGETRAVSGPESINYNDPYAGSPVVRNLDVPSVTGFAPLGLTVTTDQPAYGPNQSVTITETISNPGTTNDSITSDVAIRDANGAAVATVIAADPVPGLPPVAFPGWHFAIPVTAVISTGGASRSIMFPVDFAQSLAALGLTATFDASSIRISSDDAPSTELSFSWLADTAAPTRGQMSVRVPDRIAAGATFAAQVYFDVAENGFKPLSLFNLTATGGSVAGGGIKATYGYLDTARMNPNTPVPEGIVYLPGSPVMTLVQPTTNISPPAPPRAEFWGTEWTGALYVPTTGTYQFTAGADDGIWLYIDGQLVASVPGLHPTAEQTASKALTAGLHSIRVDMFNWCCGYASYVRWAPPGQGFALIPSANLFPQMPITGATVGVPAVLPQGSVTRTYTWQTGTTASGPYTAVGTLRQYGAFVVSGSAPFSITPASQLNATLATDRAAYDPNNIVHISGTVVYASGNTPLTNLAATITVLDPANNVIATSPPATISSLLPGQNRAVAFDWPDAQSAPGHYTAKVVVTDSANVVRASTTSPFDIRSTANGGAGVTGTIATPSTVSKFETLPISVSVTNGGNAALTNAPFAVRIVDPATQQLVDAIPLQVSAAIGATYSAQLPYATANLLQQNYQAWLVSLIGGTAAPLANATFLVTAPTRFFTATLATDKATYDSGDTLHATTTVNYVVGSAPLPNVTVTTTILTSSGTSTISSIAPGSSVPATFDWPVGITAPGTYQVTSVVKDASGIPLAQASASFTVASTAVTGKGVGGTIITPATVNRSEMLPITVTITNNGNASLTGAPFAVQIAGNSIPFTATVAMGQTVTKQLTFDTTSLSPQTYTATLVSLITGQAVTLSTSTFTVLVPQVISFTATPSTIIAGQSTTLTWITANATSVSISGITASQPANGSIVISPTTTTSYVLTATGPGGTASASVTVTVKPSTASSIAANFNGTAIPQGDTVWFSSVFKVTGLSSATTSIFVVGQTIQFTANGTSYSLALPDAEIVFNDASVTSPATSFDASANLLKTRLPDGSLSGNTLLSVFRFPAPAEGLPGGIHDVTWSGKFATSSATALDVHWQWAAAVYESFGSNYNQLGIKPVDVSIPQYPNSDHAGTPENFKTSVTGGATGGGGSNWTGSYSGTASVVPTSNP